MSPKIRIHLPTPLRPHAAQQAIVELEADTVGEALRELVRRHDGLERHLYDGDGALRRYVNVYRNQDDIRVGDAMLSRFRPRVRVELSPSALFNYFFLQADVGQEIDFANAREGSGVSLSSTLSLRPTEHLELRADVSRRWLDVDTGLGFDGRLFTARVERLRGTYTFDPRSFVRLIGQHVRTDRDPALYTFAVDGRQAGFSLSALFAYKLNWQTVLFLGYGDNRALAEDTTDLQPTDRSLFIKLSYAFQH